MGKPQLTTQETLRLAREAKRVVEQLNKRLKQVELVADHAKTMQDMNNDVALGLGKAPHNTLSHRPSSSRSS